MVQTKTFQGISLPTLGMGAMRLPTVPDNADVVDRPAADKVLDACLAAGINYFDTAYIYSNGDIEAALGECLAKHPRDSYYLATKYSFAIPKPIAEAFEEELQRLRTDYIDFYLIHGLEEENFAAYTDEKRGILAFLLEQKRLGRIRYLGFSSHAEPETLRRFLDWYGGFDFAMIQLNYLDWTVLNAREQYEILAERGIPVWVMEPLKGGRLSVLNPAAEKILKSAEPDRSLASWSFRFLQGLPGVQMVLSGMKTPEALADNAEIFSHPQPLTEAEQAVLQQAIDAFMAERGVPCSGCRYCTAACPMELNIPLLIQAYNELKISGYTWKVQYLDNAKGPELCLSCGACMKRCPQKIRIPEILKEYASLKGTETE